MFVMDCKSKIVFWNMWESLIPPSQFVLYLPKRWHAFWYIFWVRSVFLQLFVWVFFFLVKFGPKSQKEVTNLFLNFKRWKMTITFWPGLMFWSHIIDINPCLNPCKDVLQNKWLLGKFALASCAELPEVYDLERSIPASQGTGLQFNTGLFLSRA